MFASKTVLFWVFTLTYTLTEDVRGGQRTGVCGVSVRNRIGRPPAQIEQQASNMIYKHNRVQYVAYLAEIPGSRADPAPRTPALTDSGLNRIFTCHSNSIACADKDQTRVIPRPSNHKMPPSIPQGSGRAQTIPAAAPQHGYMACILWVGYWGLRGQISPSYGQI